MESALHRAEIHAGDLGDLLVALPLEFTQPEDESVMLRKLLDGVLDNPLEESLAVEVVRPHADVFELKGAMILVPVVGQLLEQDEGAPRPVAELVLGEVARNGVDPGRELLARIESMQVSRDTDESLLYEILSPVSVTRLASDEVDEPIPVSIEEFLEGAGPTVEVGGDEFLVAQLIQ